MNAQTLCNIVYTIYSKGALLSKATGGNFSVSDSVISDLRDSAQELDREQVIRILKDAEDEVQGISFDGDELAFSGFPQTDDALKARAWSLLADAICHYAEKVHKVITKKTTDENEKFAFRIWLTRLGLNGVQYKAERNVFYQNLSGHTAFKDDAAKSRWLEKHGKKHE